MPSFTHMLADIDLKLKGRVDHLGKSLPSPTEIFYTFSVIMKEFCLG